jgi:8-oxo-dGTP diphosphatase
MGEPFREPFHGAKAAVFIGERLLTLLRDDRPDIPFPAHWDFPGGGREGEETGFETLAREMREEVGLDAHAAERLSERLMPAMHLPDALIWFYVLRLPEEAVADIVFGDEGQGWALLDPAAFMALPNAVPSLVARLRLWMAETGEPGQMKRG